MLQEILSQKKKRVYFGSLTLKTGFKYVDEHLNLGNYYCVQKVHSPIRKRVRCVWRNKELTPKSDDVKLITLQKHVPVTIG